MSVEEMAASVNWNLYNEFPENTCTCILCAATFRSHSKLVIQTKPVLLSQKPCPKCGSHSLMRATTNIRHQVIQ